MNRFRRFSFGFLILTAMLFSLTFMASCSQNRSASTRRLTMKILKNMRYRLGWADRTVKLTNGVYEGIPPGMIGRWRTEIYDGMHAFGDINNDGVMDAVLVMRSSGGGSGMFISLEAIINNNGVPKHIASVLLGDRVHVKSLSIKSGIIIIDMLTHGPSDPMCCPTVETIHKYKFNKGKLVRYRG